MCYYVTVGASTLTVYCYSITTDDKISKAFQNYFMCQSIGIQPDRDCGDSPDIQLQEFNTLTSVAAIIQGLFPLIILIFIMNCSCDRRCCKGVTRKSVDL